MLYKHGKTNKNHTEHQVLQEMQTLIDEKLFANSIFFI